MDDSDSDTAQYYDTFINRNNVTGIARTFRVGYAFCCLFQKKGRRSYNYFYERNYLWKAIVYHLLSLLFV